MKPSLCVMIHILLLFITFVQRLFRGDKGLVLSGQLNYIDPYPCFQLAVVESPLHYKLPLGTMMDYHANSGWWPHTTGSPLLHHGTMCSSAIDLTIITYPKFNFELNSNFLQAIYYTQTLHLSSLCLHIEEVSNHIVTQLCNSLRINADQHQFQVL